MGSYFCRAGLLFGAKEYGGLGGGTSFSNCLWFVEFMLQNQTWSFTVGGRVAVLPDPPAHGDSEVKVISYSENCCKGSGFLVSVGSFFRMKCPKIFVWVLREPTSDWWGGCYPLLIESERRRSGAVGLHCSLVLCQGQQALLQYV